MDNPSKHTQIQLQRVAQLETSLLKVWPSIDVDMMGGWAARHGATSAYLQVDVTNTAALTLYRGLGFTVLYDYDTLRRDIP